MQIPLGEDRLDEWYATFEKPSGLRVALVGKYPHADAYVSIIHQLRFFGVMDVTYMPSPTNLDKYDAVILPGGWGERGVDDIVSAAKICREQSIDVLIVASSLVLMLGLQYLVYGSKLGVAMRATSFNVDTASLMGVNVNRVISFTFVLGTALAAPRSWSFTTVAADAAPTVTSTFPASNATGVWTGQHAMIVFNAAMDPTTMTAVNYTLTQGATPVAGTVAYDAPSNTASFTPAVALAFSTTYTASMSTGAKSATGRNLAAARTWSFTTAAAAAMTLPVNLRTAGNYVILAKTAISTVPASAVTGDLGLSPAAATFVTGFSLTADSTTTFSRSTQVTGRVFAASYTSPTPALLTTAVSDMETAFTDAAGRPSDVVELGAGNIGGMTLGKGVYKWGTGVLIPTNITLVGTATDVWIFQIAQDLIVASGVRVNLSGGALAKNVFWQVAGLIDLGTTAHVEGVLICQTAITLHTGASVNGRLLAQSAVSIDGSTVVAPAP